MRETTTKKKKKKKAEGNSVNLMPYSNKKKRSIISDLVASSLNKTAIARSAEKKHSGNDRKYVCIFLSSSVS